MSIFDLAYLRLIGISFNGFSYEFQTESISQLDQAKPNREIQNQSINESEMEKTPLHEELELGTKTKKKKNRKKRSKSITTENRVRWGDVKLFYFSRALGQDTVPNHGTYPISLGEEIDSEIVPIDLHSSTRQEDLRQRALSIKSLPPQCQSAEFYFESRHYDHKSNSTNLLFTSTTEHDRISMLSSISNLTTFPALLNKLTKENTFIHKSRECTGCNCKSTKVDKLSVVKLKATLEKNSHLFVENIDLNSISKADLVSKVRDVLKQCPLCISNDCDCFLNGIPCETSSCVCLKGGHQPCRNPTGQKSFHQDEVKTYRQQIFSELKSIGTSI